MQMLAIFIQVNQAEILVAIFIDVNYTELNCLPYLFMRIMLKRIVCHIHSRNIYILTIFIQGNGFP